MSIVTEHDKVVRTGVLVPTHVLGEVHTVLSVFFCISTSYCDIGSPLVFGAVQLITRFPVVASIDVETDAIMSGLCAALR